MALTSLPPETERLWNFLCEQPVLRGFVLVRGTALTLRIHHRASEDLDFAFPESRLPRTRLETLLAVCRVNGHTLVHRDNPAADAEFSNAGMALRDYQQDYLANGAVKVSFFSADEPLTSVLGSWS